jgi:hypothetical protein
VRGDQGVQAGGVAELGPCHVDHERAVPVGAGLEQGRSQLFSVSDVDLLGRGHHGHAPDEVNRKAAVRHPRTSYGCAAAAFPRMAGIRTDCIAGTRIGLRPVSVNIKREKNIM